MRFAIRNQHKRIYQDDRMIEFGGFLTAKQCKDLKAAIHASMAIRLKVDPRVPAKLPPRDIYMAGRDLYRDTAAVKNLATSQNMAQILGDLLGMKNFFLAFDQFLIADSSIPFLPKKNSIEDVCCFKNLACTLIIRLSESKADTMDALSEPFAGWPTEQGSVYVVEGNWPLAGLARDSGEYLMLVYGTERCVYRENKDDAHSNSYKHVLYQNYEPLAAHKNPLLKAH